LEIAEENTMGLRILLNMAELGGWLDNWDEGDGSLGDSGLEQLSVY
jgi:hypothetical protein